jgi:excisionase family DNA binding protein
VQTLTRHTDSAALLTFSEAANRLSVSLRQFRRLIDDGKMPFIRVSERAPRIRAADIEGFIAASTISRSPTKTP